MAIASTISTIEGIIPWLILAGVIIFISIRLVIGPLVAQVVRARKRKNEEA